MKKGIKEFGVNLEEMGEAIRSDFGFLTDGANREKVRKETESDT